MKTDIKKPEYRWPSFPRGTIASSTAGVYKLRRVLKSGKGNIQNIGVDTNLWWVNVNDGPVVKECFPVPPGDPFLYDIKLPDSQEINRLKSVNKLLRSYCIEYIALINAIQTVARPLDKLKMDSISRAVEAAEEACREGAQEGSDKLNIEGLEELEELIKLAQELKAKWQSKP